MSEHSSEHGGAEFQDEEETEVQVLPPGNHFPLNSKRLTTKYIQGLARMLGLPTKASGDELRQLIDGKLAEDGRDTRNIQVVVTEVEGSSGLTAKLSLVDESGVFLQSEAVEPTIENLREELQSSRRENEDLRRENDDWQRENEDLQEQLTAGGEDHKTQMVQKDAIISDLQSQVRARTTSGGGSGSSTPAESTEALQTALKQEKLKSKQYWQLACQHSVECDEVVVSKDMEIMALRTRMQEMENSRGRSPHQTESRSSSIPPPSPPPPRPAVLPPRPTTQRRGKAPPVDPFTGENPDIGLDDWLPALERASTWNAWIEEEKLIQLAGYLKGRAWQEYNLLSPEERSTWATVVTALRSRLDPGSKVMAAQDVRHLSQSEAQPVSEFIRKLERTFQVAYGRDKMAKETRETFLHSQLQEGLRYEIMQSPAVSGALTYPELCLAAKNEEKRLAELRKRQQYLKPSRRDYAQPPAQSVRSPPTNSQRQTQRPPLRCYACGEVGHISRDCKKPKSESQGRREPWKKPPAGTKTVQTKAPKENHNTREDPVSFLESESSGDEVDVKVVRVNDGGSQPKCVKIEMQGVPMYGIVDSGADITILGGGMFKKVAAVAKLKKRQFQKPDRIPHTYDQRPFIIDGKMDLDITFDGKTMHTPVYIKMDAHDQLLLSEGVCRQLGVLTYHPRVEPWRGGKRQKDKINHQKLKFQQFELSLFRRFGCYHSRAYLWM